MLAYIFVFVDVEECLNRPCLNNASCLNTPGSFVCQCDSGWEGNICEKGDIFVDLISNLLCFFFSIDF